mmetsp:Transcript_26168/g.38713  ORF Transcript_26168/g.38713 Transcript_26168/m.38713 type:complete len:481 (+) Transcript_26168:43-1485(+)
MGSIVLLNTDSMKKQNLSSGIGRHHSWASNEEGEAAAHLANLVGRKVSEKTHATDENANEVSSNGEESSTWSRDSFTDDIQTSVSKCVEGKSDKGQKERRPSSREENRFPTKLMRILDSEEYKETFSWNKKGDAIIIHKPYDLISQVLTTHFDAKEDMKFDSFLRKLYRWGFSKHIVDGPDSEGEHMYIHDNFQKGRNSLCAKIICISKPSSRRPRRPPRRRKAQGYNFNPSFTTHQLCSTIGTIPNAYGLHRHCSDTSSLAAQLLHQHGAQALPTQTDQLQQWLAYAGQHALMGGSISKSIDTNLSRMNLRQDGTFSLLQPSNNLRNQEPTAISREIEKIQQENELLSVLSDTLRRASSINNFVSSSADRGLNQNFQNLETSNAPAPLPSSNSMQEALVEYLQAQALLNSLPRQNGITSAYPAPNAIGNQSNIRSIDYQIQSNQTILQNAANGQDSKRLSRSNSDDSSLSPSQRRRIKY